MREVWIAADQDDSAVLDDIAELAQSLGVPVQDVTRTKLHSVARTESPQGVLARAGELPETDLDDLVATPKGGPPPFLLATDGVTDPGNLGALLRSAECAGVTGVVLPRHRAVHITPTVTKAAAGSIEYLRFALVGGLPTAIRHLQEAGVWVVGLDAGGARRLFDLEVADRPDRPGARGRGRRACRAWSASGATRWCRSRWVASSARSTWPPPGRWPASRWLDAARSDDGARSDDPARGLVGLVARGERARPWSGAACSPTNRSTLVELRRSASRPRWPRPRATPATIRWATSASTPRRPAS